MKKAFFDIFVVNNIICPNRIMFLFDLPVGGIKSVRT